MVWPGGCADWLHRRCYRELTNNGHRECPSCRRCADGTWRVPRRILVFCYHGERVRCEDGCGTRCTHGRWGGIETCSACEMRRAAAPGPPSAPEEMDLGTLLDAWEAGLHQRQGAAPAEGGAELGRVVEAAGAGETLAASTSSYAGVRQGDAELPPPAPGSAVHRPTPSGRRAAEDHHAPQRAGVSPTGRQLAGGGVARSPEVRVLETYGALLHTMRRSIEGLRISGVRPDHQWSDVLGPLIWGTAPELRAMAAEAWAGLGGIPEVLRDMNAYADRQALATWRSTLVWPRRRC